MARIVVAGYVHIYKHIYILVHMYIPFPFTSKDTLALCLVDVGSMICR